MSRLATCHKCHTTTLPQKAIRAGWLRVDFTYADGNKWRQYTCRSCRSEAAVADGGATPSELTEPKGGMS